MRALLGAFGFVAVLGLCLVSPALAGEAEDAAVATHQIRQKYCAEAATKENTEVAKALNEIMPVFVQVSEVYDATQEEFLLYWRGVLQECIGKEELAQQDLNAFLASKKASGDFPDLALDAQRRLRRMQRAAVRGASRARYDEKPPLLLLGLGGGASLMAVRHAEPSTLGFGEPFAYATAQVDLSVRLVGPLRVLVHGRFGFSETYSELEVEQGDLDNEFVSLLAVFGAGVEVRIAGPVSPRFGALFQLAPNPTNEEYGGSEDEYGGAVLAGAAGLIGVDIPMGTSAVSLRPQAEVGFLGRGFLLRLTLGAAFGFP